MAFDTARSAVVLFGGFGAGNETYEREDGAWVLKATTGPARRYGHAMAFDETQHETILFGGRTSTGASGETWSWNGQQWAQMAEAGPAPRWGHTMVYDSLHSVALLFGGTNGSQVFNDLWSWNGFHWTSLASSGPSARAEHTMVFDSHRGVAVLLGGHSGQRSSLVQEPLWEWNGATWTARGAPTSVGGVSGAFDGDAQLGTFFGGYFFMGPQMMAWGDTSTWDGNQWATAAVNEPSARYSHGTVFDSARHRLVMFGGEGETQLFRDTWHYCLPPVISQQTTTARVCSGGEVTLTVQSIDTNPLTYRWQVQDGSSWRDIGPGSLTISATVVGSLSFPEPGQLVFQQVPPAHSDMQFRCSVSNGCTAKVSEAIHLTASGQADLGSQGGEPGGDGYYDNNDFVLFIGYFFTHTPVADLGSQGGTIGADGHFDNNDLIAFIELFFEGC